MIDRELREEVMVVRPQARRLDANRAPNFKKAMGELIDEGHIQLLIDLTEVDMVDSSGLGAIVSCLKKVGGRGNVCLAGAHGAVSRLLALTRMDRVFETFDTVDDAIAAMTR
jgi:anti-sigma B factor antagonist